MQGKTRNNAGRERSIVVSNSSVIIALARICRLDLLEKLFSEIFAPETVWREVAVGDKPGSEKILGASFIHVEKTRDERFASLLKEFIDGGEAEAIALALEVNADLLLVDDRDARRLARRLGLQVMGTLGVIALAKYRGLVTKVKPVIDELVEKGFWISKKILEKFLRELGEL